MRAALLPPDRGAPADRVHSSLGGMPRRVEREGALRCHRLAARRWRRPAAARRAVEHPGGRDFGAVRHRGGGGRHVRAGVPSAADELLAGGCFRRGGCRGGHPVGGPRAPPRRGHRGSGQRRPGGRTAGHGLRAIRWLHVAPGNGFWPPGGRAGCRASEKADCAGDRPPPPGDARRFGRIGPPRPDGPPCPDLHGGP